MKKRALAEVISSVSEAETEILKLLWQQQPQSVAEIIRGLPEGASNHPSTVKTLMNRLVKKGVIDYVERERMFLYSSKISKQDFYRVKTRSFLDKFFGGEIHPLVSMFSENGDLTEKERAELLKIIHDMEKPND